MKETPMEDVIRNILDEADEPLTHDELQDEIHAKEQEAIRLLKAKAEIDRDWRTVETDRRVIAASANDKQSNEEGVEENQ